MGKIKQQKAMKGRQHRVSLTLYRDYPKEGLKVVKLNAKPSFTPIDLGISAILEKHGWGMSDRLRFWYYLEPKAKGHPPIENLMSFPPHIVLRKLNLEEDWFCHCMIFTDGTTEIYSNDEMFAKQFFEDVFVNVPPSFHKREEWEIKSEWVSDDFSLGMFCGTLEGALGWNSEKIPREVEESLFEATRSLEIKNWKSCVVMSRRAIEALMKFAYKRFFNEEPRNKRGQDLNLNDILKRFQSDKPNIIPAHWINILNSIRNIGNIPGAHPKSIPRYRFGKGDAVLALENSIAFVQAYFDKIDTEVGTVYELRIDLERDQ